MTDRKRPRSEAEAMQESGQYDLRKRRHTTQNGQSPSIHGHMQRQMGPPPTPSPTDPELEPCNTLLAPNSDIMFPLSPGLHQRPNYPKQINEQINDLGYFQDGQTSFKLRPNPPEALQSLNYQPDPWDSQGINGGTTQPIMNQNRTVARQRMLQSMPDHYWEPPESDFESSASGGAHRDSAYYTQTMGSRSLISFEPQASNQDCQSLTGKLSGMEIPHDSPYMAYQNFPPESQYPFPAQQVLQQRSQQPAQQSAQQVLPQNHQEVDPLLDDMKCEEPECKYEAKNASDQKKHKLRHEKPHICNVEGCTWSSGFSTTNDLDRHKSSKHGIISGKAWMCAAPCCSKKGKLWPRADNFRQHIKRLHPTLDVATVMDQSWELGCSQIGKKSNHHYLEQSQQEAKFSHPSIGPQQNWVSLHDLSMGQSNSSAMSIYPQDHALLPSHSVARPQDPVHLDVRDDTTHVMQIDPVINNRQAKLKQQQHFTPWARGRRVAVPKSPSKGASTSQTKPPLLMCTEQTPSSSSVKASVDSEGSKASDHSSSTPTEITPEIFLSMTSNIANQLNTTGQEKKLDLESFIKSCLQDLLDSNKVGKHSSGDSPERDSATSKKGDFGCKWCDKSKKTQCDLKKHEKRHTRPYGCTYTSCPRRFGSKNDWKRHENTQHWQIEAWKCGEPRKKAKNAVQIAHTKCKTKDQCGRVFYRRELFQAHLENDRETDHNIKDVEHVKNQCKIRRVGRNGQRGFWCGFCQEVKPLSKKALEAWDERFTHIDVEHFMKGQKIEDWFPIDKDIPRELLDQQKDGSEDEKGSDEDDSGSDVDDDASQSLPPPSVQSIKDHDAVQVNQDDDKRRPSRQASSAKQRGEPMWICCQCGDGPKIRRINDSCMGSCAHKPCGNCKRARSGTFE